MDRPRLLTTEEVNRQIDKALELDDTPDAILEYVERCFTYRRKTWATVATVLSVVVAYAILWAGAWLMRGNW